MNFARRYPLADRPIIDWDLVMVMEPLTLVQNLARYQVSPNCEKFLVVLLVLLLSSRHVHLDQGYADVTRADIFGT
jgi:hypothetical protein